MSTGTRTPEPHEVDNYRLLVEEYRFQVQLNWSRTQYLLLASVTLLAAAVGLDGTLGTDSLGRVALFLLPAVVALLGVFLVGRQHEYYRSARDQVVSEAKRLGVVPLQTTAGLQGERSTRVKVTDVLRLVLLLLAVAALLIGLGPVLLGAVG